MGHTHPREESGQPSPSRPGSAAGFTLIELIVSAAIVAVMLSIGVVSYRSAVDKPGLQMAADEMFGVIQEARMRAIREKAFCNVEFNTPETNQYRVDPSNQVVDLSKYKGNIAFAAPPLADDDPAAARLRFTPQGFAVISGIVYLTTNYDNSFYRVRTTFSGITRVERLNSSTKTWN
jgi:prepilin-type N-terminal cleavage/methylation domain-containing protein